MLTTSTFASSLLCSYYADKTVGDSTRSLRSRRTINLSPWPLSKWRGVVPTSTNSFSHCSRWTPPPFGGGRVGVSSAQMKKQCFSDLSLEKHLFRLLSRPMEWKKNLVAYSRIIVYSNQSYITHCQQQRIC